MSIDDLKFRQSASAVVERKMIEFLLNFVPAGELTITDAKTIARFATTIAFDAFNPEQPQP
jgi:hypothetical protein